jgi:biopolymer transport protein ExbB
MNLSYVFAHGDPVLIAVFLLLIAMSLCSWHVILWKTLSLRRERGGVDAARAKGEEAEGSLPDGAAKALLREARELRVSVAAYPDRETRKELLSLHLAQGLDRQRVRLDSGLALLASVGSSAPFIGLFGTVWGIYGALTGIAAKGDTSLDAVAGPMGEALIATAVGLFAAIPAVLAYNAFVRTNRVMAQDLRHLAERLAAYLSLEEPVKKNNALSLVPAAQGGR